MKLVAPEMHKDSEVKRLSRGQFRFLFLKRASDRTEKERKHIDSVLKENETNRIETDTDV